MVNLLASRIFSVLAEERNQNYLHKFSEERKKEREFIVPEAEGGKGSSICYWEREWLYFAVSAI